MNDLTTLEEVMMKVCVVQTHHRDRVVDVRALRFHALDTVEIEGVCHPVSQTAQRRISEWLGVPYLYLYRCDPWLQAQNLNAWLLKNRQDRTMLICFTDERVRAFFSNRYIPTDNHQVLELLLAQGFTPETSVQARIDDELMSISIPDPGRHVLLRDGDGYLPGFNIRNSEVGLSSLWLSAFLLRLACTNGAVLEETIYSVSYPHINQRAVMEIPNAFDKATESALRQAQQNVARQDRVVRDLDQLFGTLNRRFELTKQERKAVAWGYAYDPGQTLFHVLNAYTKASQHSALTVHSSIRMQRVGGMIVGRIGRDVIH
ncbi:MAG: DUF932 domain-containing protein [Magnetococcales bacterium]|nr:DUF932 domain-containing protein [Magnetococcales bacterium]